ncbi:MAG: hypothetical protein IPJ19_02580 [Planctomycetes bacterium]|nr:hypothetical protein [Planctomycetota bacterium]
MADSVTVPPARRRIAWGLLGALAVYIGLRALVLYTAFDSVSLWMYELYPMGTMAEFLQRGVDFPLRFYYDNAAGQILSGFLTLPCFALLGPSYLALKLVPFLMGIGVLILAWRWLRDTYGRLAANLAAWSLALAPTTLFKYSLTNSGNHFENLFFSLIAISAFARLTRLGASRARLFGFGLASGWALFVFLGALLPIGILGALHAGIRGLRRTLRDLPWIAVGLLVGQLPLLALNLVTGGRGMGFLESKFAGEQSAVAGGAVLDRIGQYLWSVPPQASTYPDGWLFPGAVWNRIFFALLLCAFLAALPFAYAACRRMLRTFLMPGTERAPDSQIAEGWPLALCVLYVPASALAFGISNFRLGGHSGDTEYGGYRYYLPWFLYGIISASVLAAKAWSTRGAWRAAVLLVPLGVLLPGLANLRLVDWSGTYAGVGARYAGYDTSKAARGLLAGRNHLERAQQLRYLEGFPPHLRASVARAIGFNLAVLQIGRSRRKDGAQEWYTDVCGIAARWPESVRFEIARGAGIGTRFTVGPNEAATLFPAVRRSLAHSPDCAALAPAFLEGLASANPALPRATQTEALSAATNGLIGLARERALPEEALRPLVRGAGFLFGQLARRGIASDLAALARRRAELPASSLPDFYAGLGQGCAIEGEGPGLPSAGFELPARYAPNFWDGYVGELRRAWSLEPAALEASLDELAAQLKPADASALREARTPR